MKKNFTALRPLVATILISISVLVAAHPEDEFCVPGEDSLDPALCAMLAEMDNPDGDVVQPGTVPVPGADGLERSSLETAALYITIGINHILPDGIDHILFVLAIFLASIRLRALLLQVSAFTVAHTVTLALAASGVITPSPGIVEPLIALTIGIVAIENLVFNDMTKWRPAIVFAFGLVHGMGFAGFFGNLGLPPDQFWSALIGFNVGVEVGQLAVLVLAATVGILLRRTIAREPRQYRRYVVLPGSAIIGIAGFSWFVERLVS